MRNAGRSAATSANSETVLPYVSFLGVEEVAQVLLLPSRKTDAESLIIKVDYTKESGCRANAS